MTISARTFRLFVSSTFSDFIAEREALQRVVFPELDRYCSLKGARFQAVDLRWGITEEAQREHDTMRICLEEIRRCQQLSPRPNFAVLLGDRYGWEPVPARIPQKHWNRLIKAAAEADRNLIEKSYRLDENAIPPVCCLPERTRANGALQAEERLLLALRRAARSFRRSACLPYFASATHQEIALGALSQRDAQGKALNPEQHVHVYVRHLAGLPQDESAKDFIDWDAEKAQVVPGARERLRGLEGQLRQQLGDHVHDVHTSWSRHGRNGVVNKAYLKRFCDAFLSHQKTLIDAELASLEQFDERHVREQAHQHFGTERARVFVGRKSLLTRIGRYTDLVPGSSANKLSTASRSGAPLILLGGGGSGKSALLARAAKEALKDTKRSCVIVLERYIGGVPGTESLMTTLSALVADIAACYDQPQPAAAENIKALIEDFKLVMGYATARRPLILYLDALDQLDVADSAWMLEWLPKELPRHVRVVASARTGTSVEQSTRRRYPRNLIEVPAMRPAEGRAMLYAWLADKRTAWFNAGLAPSTGRRLTPQQEQAVLAAFNGSALWLKLASEEASTWASWTTPRQLPVTVEGLIEEFIERRLIKQENHPQIFTERALAYLTAGRLGLSESELGRALGTDPTVRVEFESNEKTQRRWEDDKSLPPILWSRLFFDLQPYLGFAQIDGALLMRWFHREFAEVLKARYLGTVAQRVLVHGKLADTFLNLDRELRPGEANDDALFRATEASGQQVSAALRRVMEQPWQLARAGRLDTLEALITDFGFCMGKCAANRSEDLMSDIVFTKSPTSYLLPWYRHLIAWRQRLRRGDMNWPSHRILIQLTGESVDFIQRLQSKVYEKYVSASYFSGQRFKVEELRLRRITYDKLQVGNLLWNKPETFLLFDNRWLLLVDGTGIGIMIDIQNDSIVGVAKISDREIADIEKARVFCVNASKAVRGMKALESDFGQETRFPGILRIHGCELVVGNGKVEYLGRVENELIFISETQLLLINSDQLIESDVTPGCFSIDGVRLEMFEGMSWDYSRFGINVFLNETTLLSLGWETTSHTNARDEIKGEIWDIEYAGASRRCEIPFLDGIDLPLAVLGILEDGRIILAGESYGHSYIIDLQGGDGMLEHVWSIKWSWERPNMPDRWFTGRSSVASDWQWPYQRQQDQVRKSTNGFAGDAQFPDTVRYWVRIPKQWGKWQHIDEYYKEVPVLSSAEYLDEGAFIDFAGMGIIEDSRDEEVLSLKNYDGELVRWVSDVPIVGATRVRKHDIVVVKRSGIVTIRQGLG
jgi:hypothetical protein